MTNSIQERVARAIEPFMRNCVDPVSSRYQENVSDCARAAIEAMREPTKAMVLAGDLPGWDDSVSAGLGTEIRSAMIDHLLKEGARA